MRAFDCGPANLPIDTYVALRTGGQARFDRAGAFAREGRIDAALLAALLDDPYFARRPPKSTGREHFGAPLSRASARASTRCSFPDAVRTLTALTCAVWPTPSSRSAPHAARTIVSGGGAHNLAILDGLPPRCRAGWSVRQRFGIDPDAKEAIAFAILGYETLRERAAGLPQRHRRARRAGAGCDRARGSRGIARAGARGRSGG